MPAAAPAALRSGNSDEDSAACAAQWPAPAPRPQGSRAILLARRAAAAYMEAEETRVAEALVMKTARADRVGRLGLSVQLVSAHAAPVYVPAYIFRSHHLGSKLRTFVSGAQHTATLHQRLCLHSVRRQSQDVLTLENGRMPASTSLGLMRMLMRMLLLLVSGDQCAWSFHTYVLPLHSSSSPQNRLFWF